jgi:hypothetical protein
MITELQEKALRNIAESLAKQSFKDAKNKVYDILGVDIELVDTTDLTAFFLREIVMQLSHLVEGKIADDNNKIRESFIVEKRSVDI